MKKLQILLVISASLILGQSLYGQGPPNPPGDPSTGGGPVGGSAPLSDGVFILLIVALVYTAFKYRYIAIQQLRKLSSLLVLTAVICFTAEAQTAGQLQRLQQISKEKTARFITKKQEAISKAALMGIPVYQKLADGGVMELMYFTGDQPAYYITNNKISAASIATNKIQTGGSTGNDLNGATEVLGIWDGGQVRITHREFGNRVTISDVVSEVIDHATHVAGTMIASGVDTNARGMSDAAGLLSYDWNDDEAEMATAAAEGLFVSNHSYGYIRGWNLVNESGVNKWYWYGDTSISTTEDYLFGFYDSTSMALDEIAANAPYYLMVRSAGNDRGEGPSGLSTPVDGGATGYDCIPQGAIAKNILSIGAVLDIPDGYDDTTDVITTSFTSWGPADDGRIKPDLVANGASLYSSVIENDSAYSPMSGTSMASPSIAGSAGLLLQHQRNLYGNVVYRASTLKALLIHTADEAGPDPGPDYMFGWGLANFERAAALMESAASDCINIREFRISQGETLELTILKEPTRQLRATVCWTDPAGIPPLPAVDPDDPMLVNDIDLRISSGGTTYLPWVLDPLNPADAAETGDNIVDNVEQVLVNNADHGLYTITISHKGTLKDGEQIVSLVVSGNRAISANSTVNNQTIHSSTNFWAHDTLNVSSTNVGAGADVELRAGRKILLKDGLVVHDGAQLFAKTDSSLQCNGGSYTVRNAEGSSQQNPPPFVYERTIVDRKKE